MASRPLTPHAGSPAVRAALRLATPWVGEHVPDGRVVPVQTELLEEFALAGQLLPGILPAQRGEGVAEVERHMAGGLVEPTPLVIGELVGSDGLHQRQ